MKIEILNKTYGMQQKPLYVGYTAINIYAKKKELKQPNITPYRARTRTASQSL